MEELAKYISTKLKIQFNYERKDHVNNLIAALRKQNIKSLTQFPRFNNIDSLVSSTNEKYSTIEDLVYRHLKPSQIGRGEVWTILSISDATKANKMEKCDVIHNGKYEFKEQFGDMRFHNNDKTIEILTSFRKNMYIIDRGLNWYHPKHLLSKVWNDEMIMDKPNEFSEGKLKKIERIFKQLRKSINDFKHDLWMYDAIQKETFTYALFKVKMKKAILCGLSGVVIVNNGEYAIVNDSNDKRFEFSRITIGEPKFVYNFR